MNGNQVINSKEEAPDWNLFGPEIRKIVVGRTPGDSDEKEKPLRIEALPGDFASRFCNLTHLFLWGIEGLKELRSLPPKLKCLDLRGCKDLQGLPELPTSLETLDLGDCTGLEKIPETVPPGLTRFYFNGCGALEWLSLGGFLKKLKAAPVVEIDGSGSPAIPSLKEFPMIGLRKLVLKDCGNLKDIKEITAARHLDHLNLTGCAGLTELPDLPESLRYLVLHKAENLRVFLGQDIGPYDRGEENENVAKAFRTRRKFGGELAVMAHAKVLLMGDGRVGKTTLAKRLRWEELTVEDRRLLENQPLKPSWNEPFTHKVSFLRWETRLCLAEKEGKVLAERAAAAGLNLAGGQGGGIEGAVRIWDFGGQEIYHATHRIFASEGSIFLLVWRSWRKGEHERAAGSCPDDVTPEEWKEYNRSRSLDYWLDYIYSMRPNARVALVCTNCPNPDQSSDKPDWKAKSRKHKHRELPVFFVDSLDEDCGSHQQYQKMVEWVHQTCGQEARRIGIIQPRFYRQASDLLDSWLEQNSTARRTGATAKHLLCPWEDWKAHLELAHREGSGKSGINLEEDDVTAITEYLHAAGHLFYIRHDAHRAILVDQEWAADLIYRLLLCGGELRRKVKGNGGWFYQADLEADPLWIQLKDPLQQQRLLAYMEECSLVKHIVSAERHPLGQNLFLALDNWLLPSYEVVEHQVNLKMELLREQPGMTEPRKVQLEDVTLSEFEFRSLQAFLARRFGSCAVYFRNGLQATDSPQATEWCFRMRWVTEGDDPFTGKIDALLVGRRSDFDRLVVVIEDLLYTEGSPIARLRKVMQRSTAEERDLGHEFFRSLRAHERDLAFSSSGADRAEAIAINGALKAAGLPPYWYGDQDCRQEQQALVMGFMNGMQRQPSVLLLISEGYLRNDPENNWYCAWELADAIVRLGEGKRTEAQTLVIFKENPGFRFSRFNEVAHKLLTDMGSHFKNAYGALALSDLKSFKYFDQFAIHFAEAIEETNWGKFIEARGSLGCAIDVKSLKDTKGADDYSSLIKLVAKAAGKTPIL